MQRTLSLLVLLKIHTLILQVLHHDLLLFESRQSVIESLKLLLLCLFRTLHLILLLSDPFPLLSLLTQLNLTDLLSFEALNCLLPNDA